MEVAGLIVCSLRVLVRGLGGLEVATTNITNTVAVLLFRGGTGREFRRVRDPGTRQLVPGLIWLIAGSRSVM